MRVLRKVFGPKGLELRGGGENYIMRSFIICTFYEILLLLDPVKEHEISGVCSSHRRDVKCI
jgi:hypothetical protein